MTNLLLENNDTSAPITPSSDQPNAGEIIQKANEIKQGYYHRIQGPDHQSIDSSSPPPPPPPPADPPPPPPSSPPPPPPSEG